jgi:hypothetical protein
LSDERSACGTKVSPTYDYRNISWNPFIEGAPMDHPPSPRIHTPFPFGGHKRLKSGDRVWLVTDARSYTDKYLGWSEPQQWFEVGAVCLKTNRLFLVRFSIDDVKAMLKAGILPAPWPSHQRQGIGLTRLYHGSQGNGRFREKVSLIDLDPELLKHGASLRAYFERQVGLRGNVVPGAWKEMQDAADRENRIEAAAISFTDWFSASDIKKLLGEDINVTHTLDRMVEERLLITNGKAKRGRKYMAAPPIFIDRADWTD